MGHKLLKRLCSVLLLLALLSPGLVSAKAIKHSDYHWAGVERVIAISDLHGDYAQYINVMRSAGLIDSKGKWSGGQTHMVQTGDITDRGDDSRKIIDHLLKLAKQAKRKGGYVHLLIGNHEAMNVVGDLRYVTVGEFAAFKSKNSLRLQNLQWQRQFEWMSVNNPEFDRTNTQAYRQEWEKRVPLGWVEHRLAWALDGQYGKWVRGNAVVVRINDTIFLHGGISTKYCKFSLESLTEQFMTALETYDPRATSIVNDPLGPVWYRGLASDDETEAFTQTIDNILNRYGVRRIVVGHTPTGGVIWPRFDQRIIVNDTGIASHYGAHKGVLELTAEGAAAIYGDHKIPIPTSNEGRADYLQAVIEVDANNEQMKTRLQRLLALPEEAPDAVEDEGIDLAVASVVSCTK